MLGCPIVLKQKLKSLKAVLKVWNKETFGNVMKMIEKLRKR